MTVHLITLSALILAVLLVRAIFRKSVPSRLIYALWLVVAIKLCLPFSFFEVELPMLGAVQTELTNAPETQVLPDVSKAPAVTDAPILTPITPIVPQQPTVSQQIVDQPITPQQPTVTVPTPVGPASPSVDVPEAPPAVEKTPIDWTHILQVTWFTGSVLLALWFAATGTVFHQKLHADRRLHTTVGKTKVYISASAGAPCLAGVIPAIYLTPDAVNSESQTFVITHEYIHLRHGDHIWALLRMIALIAYWWNPLVWVAVFVSKQDAELACDEAVAEKLSDSQRLAYAHTILDTIPQKHRYAIGLGSAPIKERITMLTKRHKNRVIAAVLAVVLTLSAVGCSFIRPKEETDPVDDTPDPPSSITTTPGDTTATDIVQTPNEEEPPVRVLSNEGNMDVHTVMLPLASEEMNYVSYAYNERYTIYLTCEQQRTAALYVVDALNGKNVAGYILDLQARPYRISYTDNGCILLSVAVDDGVYRVNWALSITENNGVFSVTSTEIAPYPQTEQRFVSADEKYIAYETIEDGWGNGGIDIKSPDGSVKRIRTNVMLGDTAACKAEDIGDVIGYVPIGFLDEVHLAYWIGGWEWTVGYGIYNVATNESVETKGTYRPVATYDGALFVEELQSNGDGTITPYAILKVTPDGKQTKIASEDANESVYIMSEKGFPNFENSMWYTRSTEDVCTVTLYSPDLDQKLAQIEYPYDAYDPMKSSLLICENSVTVVVPSVYGDVTVSSLADWESINYDGALPTDGNCYELINGLVHFGGGADLAERYPELNTVKISDYTILRKENERQLYFDFTVTESGMATIPAGNYKTLVWKDVNSKNPDARINILSCDAADRVVPIQADRKSAEYLSAWLLCIDAWDMPDYGAFEKDGEASFPERYLAHIYEGTYTPEEFNALAMDTFGVEFSADDPYLQQLIGGDGKIKLSKAFGTSDAVYDIVGLVTEGDVDILTVQHYNDSNKLIPSVKVEYRIGTNGRLYGCKLVEDSRYRPLSPSYPRYTYKEWKPLTDVVSILSLADWENINFDGSFPADGNCYELINGLVHFGGKPDLADRYPELDTVKISDYTISRRKDERILYFDFTIAESGLDTLPIGNYKTEVYPDNVPAASGDARLEIVATDAALPYADVKSEQNAVEFLSSFIASERAWDMGDYGKYGKEDASAFPENYLAWCFEGRYTLDEFNAITQDKIGMEFSAEDQYIADNLDSDGKIRLLAGFGGFACRYDIADFVTEGDAHTVTLQYYADANGLIPSIKVAYRIGDSGQMYGCELIETSKYAPFGSVSPRYKYKDWQPLEQ